MRMILLLFLCSISVAQEHAPTIEQCRADAAVWSKADTNALPLSVLAQRATEMNDCVEVDPGEQSHDAFLKYVKVSQDFGREYTKRLISFMERHNLRKQFNEEDTQGKR